MSYEPMQTLWIGGRLSTLERLALTSFLAHGHPVHLYTYGDVANVPTGVTRCDANAVLPESSIFRFGPEAGDGEGSVAGFADVFRLKLLHDKGGWWIDTDVVCLEPFNTLGEHCFGWQDEHLVNTGVMHAPLGSEMIAAFYKEAARRATRSIRWGEIGPNMLSAFVPRFGLSDTVLPPHAFYPIHFTETRALVAPDPDGTLWQRLDGAYALHFWNEMFRRHGIDKDAAHPESSIYARLQRQYGVSPPARPVP